MSQDINRAKRFPVVLFPHTGLQEIQMKWALSFFDALILCLPWYMEPSPWVVSRKEDGLIDIRRPKGAMKPEASFSSLLAEYRSWARENLDKGLASYYGARWDPDSFIENTWKIRQDIRGVDEDGQNLEITRVLKWHLILHLAREIEEMRTEAANLLTDIHEKGSPLRALFEDGSNDREGGISFSPFNLDHRRGNLSQTLEAWFGLFETCGKESPVWLTWDEEVWNFLSEGDEEKTGNGEPALTFRTQWPDLSRCHTDELNSLKKKLFQREPFRELRRRVAHFGRNPSSDKDDLARFMKELDPFLPWDMSDARIELLIRSVVVRTPAEAREKGEAVKQDSLKTLVLLKGPSKKC